MLEAASKSVPWLLGSIEEGWEWFAFTFNDQDQLKLTKEEIEKMVIASDPVTKQAYSRMLLDNEHKWSTHTKSEVDFILNRCGLVVGQRVLDVGCGLGRHAMELAKRGMQVTGIDYIPKFIERAKLNASQEGLETVEFVDGDCRNADFATNNYDAVICLYDVVGTFVDEKENSKILRNIARSLGSEGAAIISVMNYELTRHNAKYLFSFEEEPNRLLELEPAGIMEKTGDIFDPNYYIVDEQTHVVYRKEQFTFGNELPTELIVRDKRYSKPEIVNLCEDAGLSVQWAKYVRAGKWGDSLEPVESSAKEIMVFCKKKA